MSEINDLSAAIGSIERTPPPDVEDSPAAEIPESPPNEPEQAGDVEGPNPDAEMDRVLMALDSHEEEVGVPAPAETPEPQEAPEALEAPEATPEPEPLTQPTAELEAAYEVLKRDGWKPEALTALDEATVLEVAAHRRKTQADVDRLVREGKSADEPQSDQTQRDPEPSQAEATGQPQPADLIDLVKPVADHLGLDEDGTKLLASVHEATVKPLQDRLVHQDGVIEQLQAQMVRMEVERVRRDLKERFPQLADPASSEFEKVIARMDELGKSGQYDTMDALMRTAVGLEFGDALAKQAETAQTTIRKARAKGQPASARKSRPDEKGKLSQEELQDKILDILESGEPDRIARARALGGR